MWVEWHFVGFNNAAGDGVNVLIAQTFPAPAEDGAVNDLNLPPLCMDGEGIVRRRRRQSGEGGKLRLVHDNAVGDGVNVLIAQTFTAPERGFDSSARSP